MLWYKAWLETRLRFLICLVFITGFCSWQVFRMDHGLTSPVNDRYYNRVLHTADSQIALWWLAAVSVLTMGGLLREKAVGAASFTLALPYSRTHLTGVRMAVSLMQAIALIVIPWIAVFVTGSVAGNTHSVGQALFHLALMVGGGVVLYGTGFLVSSVVEGEYTAPMVSVGVVMTIGLVFGDDSFRSYSPISFMMGAGIYNPRVDLLTGAVPWLRIAVFTLAAVILLALSIKTIQKREF